MDVVVDTQLLTWHAPMHAHGHTTKPTPYPLSLPLTKVPLPGPSLLVSWQPTPPWLHGKTWSTWPEGEAGARGRKGGG